MNKLSMMLLILCANVSMASTVKIGNGDDGSDLEGTVKISSGPVFESRKKAIAHLKALNVQGIAGLGTLIPELEHSDLLMASFDVAALSSEGGWESSDDRKKVFARTFAEPHSPTRFFPAALSLNSDQLVALHTHEALHRALPADIRQNEEKVAILTMALTSPSATFDRVQMVARNVMGAPAYAEPAHAVAMTSASAPVTLAPEPEPVKTRIYGQGIANTNPINQGGTGMTNLARLGAEFSPFGTISAWKRRIEPRMIVEGILINDPGNPGLRGGPISFIGKVPLSVGSEKKAGALARVSLRSIENSQERETIGERDVYEVGGYLEFNRPYEVRELKLTYALPSTTKNGIDSEFLPSASVEIGSIWSLTLKEGWKWKRFTFAGNFELHHARQAYRMPTPLTILRAGPEVTWKYRDVTLGAGIAATLNRTDANLDNLADIAGHGAGKNSAIATLAWDI